MKREKKLKKKGNREQTTHTNRLTNDFQLTVKWPDKKAKVYLYSHCIDMCAELINIAWLST